MKPLYEQLNPYACKTYLIGIEGSNEIVLIDPVIDHVRDYVKMIEIKSSIWRW